MMKTTKVIKLIKPQHYYVKKSHDNVCCLCYEIMLSILEV